MKKLAIVLLVLGVFGVSTVAFAFRYRYESFKEVDPVGGSKVTYTRTNRFSGSVETFDKHYGWIPLGQSSPPSPELDAVVNKILEESHQKEADETQRRRDEQADRMNALASQPPQQP